MTAAERFADAERRLFARYGLDCESRQLRLKDPPVRIAVREFGAVLAGGARRLR